MSARTLPVLLALAALLLLAPAVGHAQTATMDGFGRGSGSLADVLRGTHSRASVPAASSPGRASVPVTRSGSVRERVQGMRHTLSQPATRTAARGGLWRAIGGAAARAAPIAGAAALADSPVVPIGDVIGLGIIAVAIGSEVISYYRSDDRDRAVPGARTDADTQERSQRSGMRVQLQEQRGGRTVHHHSIPLTASDDQGVRVAQVVEALRVMRDHRAIPRRQRSAGQTAYQRAVRWTQARPPAGVGVQGSQSFYFADGWRIDIENVVGHNLTR